VAESIEYVWSVTVVYISYFMQSRLTGKMCLHKNACVSNQ